ncbi:MinD/ParA family protein [Serpentinicella alkaliphila]|uniref:Flagellar biosynthesis protein FlhG n=1 Tax=Serpentinicella alkaliphila TaxID=1734049 RepID=A0A4R2TQ21_9FIRM|nr:MinD/ParA family protein [Serpentinicella alkaliphila]QUH26298.1 MinD/ParA family protein [Serpentinicella alkaliphila]TCQ05878.1 flagellar biosynthesis protein FlhG [Serpentinicella alkaliphila]
MMDQASKLREMISRKSTINEDINLLSSNTNQASSRIICITSGKGGVGKTNFTINLAIALSKQDLRVVVIDADLGLANIDVVTGSIPKFTLLDIIRTDRSIEEIMNDGPGGVKIISGGSGVLDLVDMPQENFDKIIGRLDEVCKYADIILIDTGAGISKSVMSFVLAANEVIVVTTPEPTAITDAYAMIKTVSLQDKGKKIKVVINRSENINEGKITFEKLQNASEKFLNVKIEKLGYLVDDSNVSRAVKLQNPFLLQFPNARVSKNIELIALNVNSSKATSEEGFESKGFFNKVISFFK